MEWRRGERRKGVRELQEGRRRRRERERERSLLLSIVSYIGYNRMGRIKMIYY